MKKFFSEKKSGKIVISNKFSAFIKNPSCIKPQNQENVIIFI